MSRIDLSNEQLGVVREILHSHIPEREVRVFGSRVKGNAKPASDLDLCVMGESSLPTNLFATLQDAFSESSLPFKVDLLCWADVNDRFRSIIADSFVRLQVSSNAGIRMPVKQN